MQREFKNIKELRARDQVWGFSITELLVVISILAVIGSVSFLNLLPVRCRNELNRTTRQLGALFREAESRAMSQESSTSWGVYLDNQSTPFYALFAGATYSPSTRVRFEILPETVRYTSSSLGAATTSVTFAQLTGIPSTSTAITLEPINCGSVASSTITVSSNGRIVY